MKTKRLGPKHANRRRRRSTTTGRMPRRRWNRNHYLLGRMTRRRARHKQPTDQVLLLRLINILGLALLVMVVAILGSNENLAEIVELARRLFQLLP